MSHTVVLHIGAMKSGTSFVQRTLSHNASALAEQGFLFPGAAWRDQVHGVIDALDQTRDDSKPPRSVGAWQRLLDQMAGHDGASVISMEFLAATPPDVIRRVLSTLAPAKVEVVLTARDLGRNIPAMWQEGLKNRSTWTWEEFLDGVEHGDPNVPGVARRFWRHIGAALIARRWAAQVGRENFTLVTVPPPGAPADELWRRFCSVVGLDPAAFTLPSRENASLGAASALVLRAVNEHVAGVPEVRYNKVVKHLLAKQGMAARRSEEQPIGFSCRPWVEARADLMIQRLRDLDLRVVGDLEELRPQSVPGTDPSLISLEEREQAAVAALAFLVDVWSASQTSARAGT